MTASEALQNLLDTIYAGRLVPDSLKSEGLVNSVVEAAEETLDYLKKSEMKYTLDTPDQVFFYEQDFYVLSNFSSFQLKWKGYTFPTSEHAYQWAKFANLGKRERMGSHYPTVADIIRKAPSAHEAFKTAERWKAYRREDWDDVKVDIMRGILRAKVAQHNYVRRKLIDTGDRILIENSWRDDFWGWGPNRDGQNMLGKIWMEIRDELGSKQCET